MRQAFLAGAGAILLGGIAALVWYPSPESNRARPTVNTAMHGAEAAAPAPDADDIIMPAQLRSPAQVVGTLPVGDTPHGIDVSEDGNTVFIALTGEDRLAAVDLGNRTSRSVALAPAPYHLSAIRGRGVLYVSSAEDSRIWVVDAATLAVTGEIAIPGIGHQLAQTPAN